ncbi:MAG: 2-oxoglutarate carboxylase large subunit [Syntrophorhabdus sp. PtaU1.Bin153]|nr:MAG: 2-oxoglutarate carboxylase large subunit [Syntrophorhabdus sp. PtaU1.Bin153]
MQKIEFIDQTIRDAQQSAWGYMMRTDHITPIAETMDKVGYRNIATVGSQAYTVQVRTLGEDPWERIRTLEKMMPKTPIRGSYQIGSLSAFDLGTPRDIIALWIKRSVANGCKSFWVCDYQSDMAKFDYFARIAKEEGAEVVPALMWTKSPAHTLEQWAHKTRLLAASKYIDRIMIEDASGIISPEETRELVKTVRENCSGLPLELHIHCNSGLAPICYLEAMKEGITTFHTVVAPMAHGTSLPPTETVLRNAKLLGFTSDMDEDALAAESKYFREITEREGFAIGVPTEYDLYYFQHQVPGGMMTNFTRQLREVGMIDKLDAILEECIEVRKDLGFPVMATPFSQIVGAQALENVLSGERYKNFTDETLKYIAGCYGEPIVPVDQNLLDKVMDLPKYKGFIGWTAPGYLKTVEEIRKDMGAGPELSDDDLLLKYLIPGQPAKRPETKRAPAKAAAKGAASANMPPEFPTAFNVEVDGETFNVRISPSWDGEGEAEGAEGASKKKKAKEALPGAISSGMAGLVLSFEVNVGDTVSAGDLVAMIEAMKMRRHVNCPHSGVVKEICAEVGEIVEPEDILMTVV